jgi:hypothetical protein
LNPILFPDHPPSDKPISSSSITKWLHSYFKSNCSIATISDNSSHPRNMPAIFLDNPELSTSFQTFAADYHGTLNAESAKEYLITIGFPAIVNSLTNRLEGSESMTLQKLMNQYNLTSLSLSTVSQWMNTLGYKFNERKKCYYTDNHEKRDHSIL